MQSPSKLNQSYTAEEGDATSTKTDPIPQPNFNREVPPSPTKGAQAPGQSSPIVGNRSSGLGVPNDAVSKLPAHQAREIREAFQVLDRDNDGKVHKDDVVDVLMNLGMDLCMRQKGLQANNLQAKTPLQQQSRASSRLEPRQQSTSRPS